ncbi:MAG: tol-pal system YbgF family protein [Vicinamibacteria bacterium]
MRHAACALALGALLCQAAEAQAPRGGLAPKATPTRVQRAETLALEASQAAASDPAGALAKARNALALTSDFEPTAFVGAGRKGEVVEDAYVEARRAYRRHRARLYQAVGVALAACGRHDAAVRYLARSVTLDADGGGALALARSLASLGRGREALDAVLARVARGTLSSEALAVAARAADAARIACLQCEIDRLRLAGEEGHPAPELRDGPFPLTGRERLSTGSRFGLQDEQGTLVLYLADPSCRSCSADLEAIARTAPPSARVVLAPPGPDQDTVLRRAAASYRYPWPVVVGPGVAVTLRVAELPAVLLVARRGYLGVVLGPPFASSLPPVFEALARSDVSETLPRAEWNRRPAERPRPPQPPGLLEGGLAPGEDLPAPPVFEQAVAAYRAGRPGEALRLFEALEAEGDGWLLPPEARLDRGLCLAGLGRREEARQLLLRTGDSRFQDEVDRALERVAAGRRR